MTDKTQQPGDKAAETQPQRVQFWLGEIQAARKREKDWRKEGKRALEIYNGAKKDKIPFNILYSNTDTMLPALYNSAPRPVVQRRFKDDDPLGKAASQAGLRTLEFTVDTNSDEYASFDDTMSDAVLDALLPGRAGTRVKYDAEIVGEKGNRYVKWELVCFESQKWDRWLHGYAKKWKRVPWIAFEHDVDLEEAKELFGEKANKLTFTEQTRADDKEDEDGRTDGDKTDEDRKVAKVWEIWVKRDKKVIFISPNYADDYLKEDEDPLNLTGFFPMPQPLRFLRKSNDLHPVVPYSLYENQAKELNRLTTRINRVAEAIKVRGAYDSTISELAGLLKADDNVMVPAENVAAMTEHGLEKAIWIMPLEKLIVVLQQLYIARENCKKVIYEITGVSDILRGQTVASETATAQQIKNQWGTLRLKRMQREVARYSRDLLRLALEIAAKKFNENTFAGMTGLPFQTQIDVAATQGKIAALKSSMAMMGPQPQAMPGMPPQQPNPQMAQAAQEMQQLQQQAQQPVWAKVMETLREDTQRMYRIDIETNSTVDVEATEDQKIMGEVLQAMGQFMQAMSPLIISGSMPFQVAQSMLLAIVRRYRFGSEIEDYIKQMQPPAPPDQGKKEELAAKAKMEQEKHQLEMKKAEAEFAQSQQESQAKIAMERELAAIEKQVRMEELQAKREEIRLKKELLEAQTTAKIATLNAQVVAARAMPKKEPARAGT